MSELPPSGPVFWGRFPVRDDADEMRRHPETIEMSRGEMYLAAATHILRNGYGFVQAANLNRPLDKQGQPLPLYTYPAIEYLLQFDYRSKTVFEFGAGTSTLFWMRRAARVVSVENNREWFEGLKSRLAPNAEIVLEEGDGFPFAIERHEQPFDVIVVDGYGYRYDSAQAALGRLARGGLIVLDNADWHHRTAALLKGAGLLQVDMTGLKPTEHHTSTTSLFFHREFDFPTLLDRQPAYGIGSKQTHSDDWDRPYAQRPGGASK